MAFKFLDPSGRTMFGGLPYYYNLPTSPGRAGAATTVLKNALDEPPPSDDMACGPGRLHVMRELHAQYAPDNYWPWWARLPKEGWRISGDEEKEGWSAVSLQMIRPEVLWRAIRSFGWGHGCVMKMFRWSHADLHGADLEAARLSGGMFQRVNLKRANLRCARMNESAFVDCEFGDADLRGAQLINTSFLRVGFEGARISGADISGRMSGCSFVATEARSVNWAKTHMVYPRFDVCDLSGCYFGYHEHMTLVNCNLMDARLEEIQPGWHIENVNLIGARLMAEKPLAIRNALYDKTTAWPVGFDPLAIEGGFMASSPQAAVDWINRKRCCREDETALIFRHFRYGGIGGGRW